jgi:hypothetical protein
LNTGVVGRHLIWRHWRLFICWFSCNGALVNGDVATTCAATARHRGRCGSRKW